MDYQKCSEQCITPTVTLIINDVAVCVMAVYVEDKKAVSPAER